MNKFPASLRSDFSVCRFASEQMPICFGIGADFSGIRICLARSLEKIRIPAEWRGGLDTGRLLLLSPFEKRPRRPTVESSHQRNELVAALADEVLIIHAEPNGSVARISQLLDRWKIPRRVLP
jgi:hypothetical protein